MEVEGTCEIQRPQLMAHIPNCRVLPSVPLYSKTTESCWFAGASRRPTICGRFREAGLRSVKLCRKRQNGKFSKKPESPFEQGYRYTRLMSSIGIQGVVSVFTTSSLICLLIIYGANRGPGMTPLRRAGFRPMNWRPWKSAQKPGSC